MSQVALKPWGLNEFFAWQERQEERYELVGGQPIRMMAGTSNRHDDIVVNLIGMLREQLRGKPCRPFTGDGSVETYPGQIRRPDAGVDCGRRDPSGYRAAEVRLVAEVLSPSTRDFDAAFKVPEYKSVESLDYILLVEPNAPEIVLWERDEARTWAERRIEGLSGTVDLPALGLSLSLSDLYEGVDFPATPPRLAL